MRVLNGTLAALTLALMMVFGEVQTVQAEGAPGDTTRAGTQITFEQAMQIALEKNITLAQAQNAVASSDATVRGAKLSFLPNLQLNTSGAQTYGRNFSETGLTGVAPTAVLGMPGAADRARATATSAGIRRRRCLRRDAAAP